MRTEEHSMIFKLETISDDILKPYIFITKYKDSIIELFALLKVDQLYYVLGLFRRLKDMQLKDFDKEYTLEFNDETNVHYMELKKETVIDICDSYMDFYIGLRKTTECTDTYRFALLSFDSINDLVYLIDELGKYFNNFKSLMNEIVSSDLMNTNNNLIH